VRVTARSLVQLRPVVAADHGALSRCAADPRVAATCNVPHPLPPDGAQALLDAAERGRARGDDRVFTILRDSDPVGVVTLTGTAGGVLTLGYWVAAPMWNQGIATAAVRNAIDRAFTDLGAARLGAAVLPHNHASIRVLENTGFRRAGDVVNDGRFGAKFRGATMQLFALPRAMWSGAERKLGS
jgi:ribosomal-protein-alanine N-acetyltransferase